METDLQSKLSQTQSGEEYFRIQLTNQQYNFIQHQLPKGYSLQQDSKHPKRQSAKYIKDLTAEQQLIEQELSAVRIRKLPSNTAYTTNPQPPVKLLNLYKKSTESPPIAQQLKPCMRILNQLKNSKTSWPFREPVDPVAFGIPNYFEIVQEPMDLQTIENNLKNNQYVTVTQFHADINKIIRNSFTFNQNNPQFIKLTSQFQRFYSKITSQQSKTNNPQYYDNPSTLPSKLASKKNKKKQGYQNKEQSDHQTPTLAEKKQLSQQIRRLSKEDLKGVVQIVYAGKTQIKDTFDIQYLEPQKIRELQRYVRNKLSIQDTNTKPQNQNPSTNQIKQDDDQSSFMVEDSDS